jgi:hypothetical protein
MPRIPLALPSLAVARKQDDVRGRGGCRGCCWRRNVERAGLPYHPATLPLLRARPCTRYRRCCCRAAITAAASNERGEQDLDDQWPCWKGHNVRPISGRSRAPTFGREKLYPPLRSAALAGYARARPLQRSPPPLGHRVGNEWKHEEKRDVSERPPATLPPNQCDRCAQGDGTPSPLQGVNLRRV